MKTLIAGLLLLGPLVAAADPARHLEPADVRERLAVVDADIRRCYLGTVGERAGAGKLELTLAIHRIGVIDSIVVSTPGLPVRLAKKIDTCVRAAVGDLEFPARRSETTVIVPYFYQRTAAPNSGPQLSCWNPKGCPDR